MEPTRSRPNQTPALRRYGPLALLVVIALVITVVVVATRGGDGKKAVTASKLGSLDKLTRSGPMTPEKAKLLGKDVDFGPECDTKLGRVKIPSQYSPPCVEPFRGDNGGATSQGVTAREITVVAYQADPKLNAQGNALTGQSGVNTDPDAGFKTLQGYAELYSKHFERYGRTVKIIRFVGTGGAADEARAKADAIAIADRYKPFAVLGGPGQTGAFADELVARKIMCVGVCAGGPKESDVVKQDPYRLPLVISTEQFSSLSGEMIAKGLKGNAEHAGDPAFRTKRRVFGALYYEDPNDPSVAFPIFKAELAKGGIELAAQVPFFLDFPRIQEIASTSIAKLKAAGVTSVVVATDPYSPLYFSKEATKQNYFPEWVIGPNLFVDLTLAARLYDQRQWAHAFGVTALAARGVQATQGAYRLYQWQFGEAPPSNTYGPIAADAGLLFTGVHLAGPTLTPKSFRDGLFRVPKRGGTAIDPTVSRGRNGLWPDKGKGYVDYYSTDDVAILYWDPEATGEDEVGKQGKGMYRFAKMGRRYLRGHLPTDTGIYDDAHSVTVFDRLPADSRPPDYPEP